jgi:antitoxin ParD1/3/4
MGARQDMPMSNVQKLSVALTPELIELVQDAVQSGEYTSKSEVVRDALRSWKLRRTAWAGDTDELRALWMEGIASGPGRFASIEDIKKEARRRLKKTRRVQSG